MFIIIKKNSGILTLSMLKHAEMGCQISADPGSPRVKPSREIKFNKIFVKSELSLFEGSTGCVVCVVSI